MLWSSIRVYVPISVRVCVSVCDYPHCYQQRAAIHSSWNERFSSVTKQFLCFHGAMILSKSHRKQKHEGGGGVEKKKSMSPSTNSRRSLAGCRHASTLTNTCNRRENKQLQRKWKKKEKLLLEDKSHFEVSIILDKYIFLEKGYFLHEHNSENGQGSSSADLRLKWKDFLRKRWKSH